MSKEKIAQLEADNERLRSALAHARDRFAREHGYNPHGPTVGKIDAALAPSPSAQAPSGKAFVDALENPPPPNEALKALMARGRAALTAAEQRTQAASGEAKRIRHKKRGSTYLVLGTATVQSAEPLQDMAEVVVYQSEHDGRMWARDPFEFMDGRFEELPPLTAAEQPKPTQGDEARARELVRAVRQQAWVEDGDVFVRTKDQATTAVLSALASVRQEAEAARTKAARDVLAERERQKSVEGWDTGHDDEHDTGQLARAAGVYAIHSTEFGKEAMYVHGRWRDVVDTFWPFSFKWFKPKDSRRDLVRAGALILAEIERLDRAAAIRAGEPDLGGKP